MDVQITGRRVDITQAFREYAGSKISHLSKFYDRARSIDIVVSEEGEQVTVEMIVRDDHAHSFVASATGMDPRKLVDATVDKLERQLRRHKEQIRER